MNTELEILFDARSLQRGRALQRKGAVVDLRFDSGSKLLHALVQGTQRQPYKVAIQFEPSGDIHDAECSCPVGFYCKHAVAAVLEWKQQQEVEDNWLMDSVSSGPAPIDPGGTPNGNSARARAGHPESRIVKAKKNTHRSHDREFADWWSRLRGVSSVTNEPMSAERIAADRERVYSLAPIVSNSSMHHGAIVAGVAMCLLDAPRTTAGYFSKGRRAHPDESFRRFDTFLTSSDKEIEALGSASFMSVHGRWASDPGRYNLEARTGQLMLQLAIETGRCFITSDRRVPVTLDQPRTLSLHWEHTSGGDTRLRAQLDGLDCWWAVASDPPFWVDPVNATAGPVNTTLTGSQLTGVLDAPQLSDSQLQGLAELMAEDQAGATPNTVPAIPPPPVDIAPLIDCAPEPVIVLCSSDDNPHVDAWRLLLFMRYANAVVPFEYGTATGVTVVESERAGRLRIRRDRALEKHWFFELIRLAPGIRPVPDLPTGSWSARFCATGDSPAIRFTQYRQLVQQKAALEREGWILQVLPPVHTEPLRPDNFDGMVQRDDDGAGWFDVSLGFDVDGVHHDLLVLVTQYIERGGGDEPLLVESAAGQFIEVPASVLQPVANTLLELGDEQSADGGFRLSRARALALEKLDQALVNDGFETQWNGNPEPFDLARRLRACANADKHELEHVKTPRGLKASLRPYQRIGVGWLNLLAKHDLCGILADDMGLGKTLQALAHILWLRQSRRLKGPVLVIAPTSLLINWARESERFAPRLNVRVWHGSDRLAQPLDTSVPPADLVVTSYALARRDCDLLANHGFNCLVLDEAQHIRNPRAKTTRAIKSLPIERRLCLSGTPVENHLGELWSQFDFLMPGFLGDSEQFARRFRTPIERYGNTDRQRQLAALVAPFILRRRKEVVATELPPKTEILREVKLGDAQAKLYESIRVAMQKRVRDALAAKGLAQSHVTVLDALLKLRQVCCHPQLLKLDSAQRVTESAKTTLVLEMLDELIAEGRRVLLFSSFTSMLSTLESELLQRGHRWVKLTGQTRKRNEAIDAFQRGDVPLFLVSLKAGGTGLNLTAADTVIHYDPWWNPAAEDQASARSHRIGQDKPVFVYRLVTDNTVEQRIVAMQQRKRELAEATLEASENNNLAGLSAEQTLALFD